MTEWGQNVATLRANPPSTDAAERLTAIVRARALDDDECWRDAPGFDGIYEVSNLGRMRRSPLSPGPGIPGRILSVRANKRTGYLQVMLRRARKVYCRDVHVLVCEAFHGPRPTSRHEVGHLDADRANAHAHNLRWMTPSENLRQAYADGRRVAGSVGRRGARHYAARLTEDNVREIRSRYRRGNGPLLGTEFGVSSSAIRAAASGRSWKHLSGGESAYGR